MPLCDATASVLVETLLTRSLAQRRSLLVPALRDDPAFALWALAAAPGRVVSGPVTLASLAQWLSGALVDHLRRPTGDPPWQAASGPAANDDDAPEHRFAALVERTVVSARRLVSGLTKEDGRAKSLRDGMYVAALVDAAPLWRAACLVEPSRAELRENPRPPTPLCNALVKACAELLATHSGAGPTHRPHADVHRRDGDGPEEIHRAERAGQRAGRRFRRKTPGPGRHVLALARKLSRLERLTESFDLAVRDGKLAAMKEFAYGAGHEINNPLANISTRAQSLLQEETDPERRRKLATINAQAMRAFDMIADAMLFAHPPQPRPETIRLDRIAQAVCEKLRGAAAEQRTELSATTVHAEAEGASPVEAKADPTHVTEALAALIRNSLEALGQGGAVTIQPLSTSALPEKPVGGRVSQDWVGWRVTDTGPGVPESVREKVFDPFFSGREAGRGLGFGLAKTWRVAELHGGELRLVDPAPGNTVFEFLLPAAGLETGGHNGA